MATPDWGTFAAGALLLTAVILVFSWASARALLAGRAEGEAAPTPVPGGVALAANVALTHGVLVAVLVGLVWYTRVPVEPLGVRRPLAGAVLAGLGLGVGLYLAIEGATAVADRLGVAYDERLREALAPEGVVEWVVLLVVTLPVVAVAEELLFRGVLVGALAAGLNLPVWGLAVGASVLFGLGHGAQGRVGIAAAAALGFVLASAFVLTGSLATVLVAHYTVDALEFLLREGLLD